MIWWKDYALRPGEWARWRIGSLELFALSNPGEWIFASWSSDDALDASEVTEIPAGTLPDDETCTFSRYATQSEIDNLQLVPRLADRAYVFRPELPLFLPAGEKLVLYVSSPVWVSCKLAGSPGTQLIEIPSFRASDTWFGRDTCDGELCYAARTRARTNLDEINNRPHRAVTPLEIRNEGNDILSIDQLRVPLPALSLYEFNDRLWTDTVSLIRDADESSATMTVTEAAHTQMKGRKLLAEPREPVEEGTIVSAFSKLLS
jgi:hypothetical protein